MASTRAIRTYECSFIEEYCVAPAPSRDYYCLKVTHTQVLLYVWRLTRGSAGHPIVRRETLADFVRNPSIQNEISRIFGDATAAQAVAIARGERIYLPHLPQGIIERILLSVEIPDIARLAQVCSKLREAVSSNSLWKVLFQKYNSGCPTPEQKKRATIVGWKRLFRSAFRYPFKVKNSPSPHGSKLSATSTSFLSEVTRRPSTKISDIRGKTTSRPMLHSPRVKDEADYSINKTYRGHTKVGTRQPFVANKLKEIAHKDNEPAVQLLYAAKTYTSKSEDVNKVDKSVVADTVSKVATKADEEQHNIIGMRKQVVTRKEEKIIGKRVDTVDSRPRTSIVKPEKTANNTSDKLTHAPPKYVEGRNENAIQMSCSLERDKVPDRPTSGDGVKSHLHAAAKSKRLATPRKGSKSIVLEESDTVLNPSRKSSKINKTLEDKTPRSLRNDDTPPVLKTVSVKPLSDKFAGTKTKIVSSGTSVAESDIVYHARSTAGSSSRKSSKTTVKAIKTVVDKMPNTARKESKPIIVTELDNSKRAATKSIPGSLSVSQRNSNTSSKAPRSARLSSKTAEKTVKDKVPNTARKESKPIIVTELDNSKRAATKSIPGSLSVSQRNSNTSSKAPRSARLSSKTVVKTVKDKLPNTSREESKSIILPELDNSIKRAATKSIPSRLSEALRDIKTTSKSNSARKTRKPTSMDSDRKSTAGSARVKDNLSKKQNKI